MKNARRFLDKLISVLLVAVICLGLVPASIVNAAVEANINLEMSIKSGYTDSAPVLPEVQSGEPFYVYIRYAMNAVSSDDKYLAPTMRIELPNNVEVAPDGIRANNHIADDANGNKMVSLETVGGKTYVVYRFADELAAGSAATLSFQAKFKNMTTPPTKDGEPAPKFEATIEGSLIPRATGIPEEFASVKGEASVKVAASSNWGIFKTVKSSEFSNDKSHFEVSYDIAVNLLKDGVDPAAAAKNPTGDFYRAPDSFGRLEFDKFEISDILPQIGANSVIAKSGAELVEIGMYLPDGTKKPLDASQYTVTNDAYGDASSIAFSDKLYSTFTAADAAKLSYVSAGDSCNTKFYLTIKFPTTSYVSQINEPLKVFTFTNDAKLTYSLVGDNADQTVSDSASAELSLRENINDDFSITVKKIIQVGNKQFILDGNAVENGYGAASFMLYTDEKCTIPAQMYDRLNDTSSDVPTLVIDKDSKDGTVKFENLRRGDYFLSENPCAGFHIESPVGVGGSANLIKITILADGTVNYNDGKIVKTAKGGSIDIINRADSDGVGIIEFVKKGTNSMGAQLALNGIEFQLYSIDADGKISDKPTKVCVSGINGIDGYVRFDGVKPGKYIIREVLLTDEQKAEYTALADVAVEAKSDTVVGVSNVFGSSDILMNRSDKGRFTIKKTDMADQPLQGANADIYFDTNNNSLLDATDEKAAENILLGTYESGPVKPGRYFVKETKAPDGYKLLTSPLTFEVSAMKSVEIALKNEKLGWLSVYKYGDWKSPDGKIQKAEIGLAGAEFEIFNDNNGSIGVSTGKTITTVIDATGKPSYDGAASVQLPSGTYWIVETKAPVGYTLDKTARKVEVQSGDIANGKAASDVYVYDGHSVIRVDNSSSDEFVRIQLTKTDKSNGRLIEGVTFKIWSSEDKAELKGVLTTDKNGVALSNPIKPGNYFIEETNTPDGYVPIGMLKGIKIENNKNIAITSGNGISVKGGETLGLLVQNEPYVSYSFTKIDSTSKKAIIDGKATFELYDGDPANGGKVIGAEKADSTGKVTFGGLVPNKQYWYREKVQPDGYVLSSAVQQFTAPSDNNQQSGQLPTFGNDHEIELVIEKTGVFDEVEKALDGADFLIYPSSVRSMPTLWQAQFDSDKAAAESANTVRTTAPTKGGKTSLKGLAPGGYWIVEKTAPTGYALEITPKFISIPAGGNTAVFQFNYRFADKANSGNLEIEKLNAITDEKMSGVTFTLYKNAAGGALGAAVAAKTTGADGKALWELLASGDYTLVETTAPDGFAKISDIINIKIEDGKTTRLTGADAIGNQPMGKIKIQKNALWYGVNGKDDIVLPLAGAEFEVYDKDGKVVATLITGADGTATSTWLADGTYTIKETKAPTGFTADAAVKTVTVKVTATEKVFSPADPFVNIHDGGKIRILKTDNANPANPLSGVKFNIWRVDDVNGAPKEIDTGGTKKTVNLILAATVTSDAKGYAVTDSLPVGQYYLEELAAPFGYAYFNRWSGVVEVIASSVTDAAVENYPTVTGSGKKVNDAGKAVPNAYIGLFTDEAAAIKAATTEFTVNQLNGLIGKKYDGLTLKNAWDIVQCAKTGGDGSFKFVDLNTARTYYIVELIAPAGHVRDVNVRTITAQNGAFAMPVITNYRFGTIEIYKSYYMSGAQRPLAGAEFELYHAVLNSGKNDNDVKNELNKLWNKANSGLSIGTVVTNGSGSKMTGLVTSGTNGALSFKNLVPGYYLIHESKAPDGFVVDPDAYYLVKVESGTNSSYFTKSEAIKNSTGTYGEFTLKKVEGDKYGNATNISLNAAFAIENKQNGTWTSYAFTSGPSKGKSSFTTNAANPTYISAPLPEGEYRIRETWVKSEYTLRSGYINFTIKAGETTVVEDEAGSGVVRNFKKGSLELQKYGLFEGVTRTPLSGVSFKLYYDKAMQRPVANSEKVTNSNGRANWNNSLDAGTYYLVETNVGNNAAFENSNALPKEITILAGSTTSLIGDEAIDNTAKYGKIAVEKVDANSVSIKLQGATFAVFDNAECAGASATVFTTDAKGKGLSELLAPGQYWLKETTVPNNYMKTREIYGPVTVIADKTNTDFTGAGSITNKKMQKAEVVKYSTIDGKPDGAHLPVTSGEFTFELYLVEGAKETKVATGTTKQSSGANLGKVLFSNLLPDTEYKIVEISAPDNYILSKNPVSFRTKTDGSTQKIEFPNEPMGNVRIKKVTVWSSNEIIDLEGATFRMYNAADNKAVGKPFTSQADGFAVSDWLEAGDYYFVETSAPAGFETEKENGAAKKYPVTIEKGKTNTVYTDVDSNNLTAIKNDAKWGRFKVSKFAAGTTRTISGAVFDLYSYNGTGDAGNLANYSLFSNDTEYQKKDFTVSGVTINGVYTDGIYISGYVPSGNYAIVETKAPAGFTVDPTPRFFEVKSGETEEISVDNCAQGAIRINKVSSEGKKSPIEGVEFKLYKGKVDGLITLNELTLVGTEKTDKNGQVTFFNLDAGVYTIQESATVKGFKLDTTLYSVNVAKKGSVDVYEQTIENVPDMGIGYIFKYAENNKSKTGLSGAEFRLFSDANCTVPVGKTIVTNAQGYAVTPLLQPGQYWVKEIKAPDGYMLDSRYAPTVKTLVIKAIHSPDISNADMAKRQNYVEFLNVKSAEPIGMPVSIHKTVSPNALAQSLMQSNSTVVFEISNFTTGKNTIPMESFTISDTKIVLKDAGGMVIPATKDDYSMRKVTVNKAYNIDDVTAEIKARVSYQINGATDSSGNPTWSADTTLIDSVQRLGAEGADITLPIPDANSKITGIKVDYFGTGKKFTADKVEVEVEFMKRAASPLAKEIVSIENTANLHFEYINKDNKGETVSVKKDAKASANFAVPQLKDSMPIVKLTNVVSGGSTQAHSPSETLSFTVTAQNTSPNEFKNPIIAIDVPAYTSLDVNSIKVTGPDGQPLGSINNAQSPATVQSLIVKGVQTQRLIFAFDGMTLEQNKKITIKYDALIDAATPKSVLEVASPAFLTSGFKLPATAANPLGTSFINHGTNNMPVIVSQIDLSVGQLLGSAIKNEYIRVDSTAHIVHSDMVSVVKQQKNALDSTFKNAGQLVYVHPDGTMDYKLTLANSLTNPVKNIRMIDIFPVYGDTLVLRSTGTGNTFDRSTEIKQRPLLTEPVTASVPVVGATAAVYYKLGTVWDKASRTAAYPGAGGVKQELPMLYYNDGKTADTWQGWLTEAEMTSSGKTYADVTAIGIEVVYPDNALMQSGESYSVVASLKMPGFTADKIAEFYNKKVANSAAASVLETGSSKPWIVENVQVISYMGLPVGTIGDYAFFDNDNNGVQSAGDTAITDLGVTLNRTDTYADGSTNRAVYTTTTDANGLYKFENLPCNYPKSSAVSPNKTDPENYVGDTYTTYDVVFDQPVKTDSNGNVTVKYAPTLMNVGDDARDSDIDAARRVSNITLDISENTPGVLVGKTDITIDAGFVAPCSLGDYVWRDINRNGIQDESGTGVQDTVVRLYRVDNTQSSLTGTTRTDSNGYYLFDNLVPGTYEVEFDISSLVKTTGYTYKYAFTSPIVNPDATQAQLDSDARFTKDADDRVRTSDRVKLNAGDNNRDVDAGLIVYSAIGGFIFDDRNYNDYQDLMYPLGGTVVTLYGSLNGAIDETKVLASQTVDGATGKYYFDNLLEGTYYVKYDFPDGYSAVNPRRAIKNGVNDETLDSNCEANLSADFNIGYSAPINLAADTVDTTWDAGARKYGAIGDYVWFDENKDGVQDPNEKGVAGVDVVLQSRSFSYSAGNSAQWQFEQRAVTDKGGYYLFSGLRGGVDANCEYRVVFMPPKQYENTELDLGGNDTTDSDAQTLFIDGLGHPTDIIRLGYGQSDLTWDMGLIDVKSALGDYIWYDANRNGLQDNGEAVLKGILCILEKNGTGDIENPNAWTEVGRMYTNDEGRYLFENLSEGYYRVAVGLPNIYSITRLERGSGAHSNEIDSDAIFQTASATAASFGSMFAIQNIMLVGRNGLTVGNVNPNQTLIGTQVINHTNAAQTTGVTFFKTRTVYLNKNTVDLTWDVGVYTVQTGDSYGVVRWVGIASMSLAAMFVFWYLLNRKKLRGEAE